MDIHTATIIDGWEVGRVGRGAKLHLVAGTALSLCGAGNNYVYSRVHRTGGPLATVNCKACRARLLEKTEWTPVVSIVAREGDTVLRSDGRMVHNGVPVGTVRHWPE